MILKIGLFILLAPVVIYMLIFILPAMPIFFGIALFIGFVIGPLLQLSNRWVERVAPKVLDQNEKFVPWPEYWSNTFRNMLAFGAVAAVSRFIFWSTYGRMLVGRNTGQFPFAPEVDYVMAACGLIYALLSFLQEGRWLHAQLLAVRNLPTSTVASVAPGLAELNGTVRLTESRTRQINPSRIAMSFLWDLVGTRQSRDGVEVGSYDKKMSSFYLDDGTGTILIDPDHPDVELRRPFLSVLGNWFGNRYFEVILTRHVEKISWLRRKYELREGDQVHVVGTVEIDPSVPSDAVCPKGFIVRPRAQARSSRGSILQFLAPGKQPTRTVHDIFIISDTDESKAQDILRKNFLLSVGLSLTLAVLSAALIGVVKAIPR